MVRAISTRTDIGLQPPSHCTSGSEASWIIRSGVRKKFWRYRSLRQILAAKPRALWTVGPTDSALTALRIMADKDIGFPRGPRAGGDGRRPVGARLRAAAGAGRKASGTTPVADIMVRDVVSVDLSHTFADCLRLMHQHGIRHLPVVDSGKAHRRDLDPRPAERGGRASRQDHRRTRTRTADHFHIDGMSSWPCGARLIASVTTGLRHESADRPGCTGLSDARRLSRLQRDPVRAGRRARRRAADRSRRWSRRCSPACSWRRWSAS